MSYWILVIGIAVIGWLVQANLKSKFEKYSQEPVRLTGREVAEKMLRDNNIHDVRVVSTPGSLTDHYNPVNKTLNLSESVYNVASVAAAAVAAHECGHAVQHATAYAPLKFRSALVPVVSFASNWMQWVLLAGILLINIYPGVLFAGIILFASTTLFSFITLPVEINASARALKWLDRSGLTSSAYQKDAEEALRAAAYTYVVAALTWLVSLLFSLSMFFEGCRGD